MFKLKFNLLIKALQLLTRNCTLYQLITRTDTIYQLLTRNGTIYQLITRNGTIYQLLARNSTVYQSFTRNSTIYQLLTRNSTVAAELIVTQYAFKDIGNVADTRTNIISRATQPVDTNILRTVKS